MTEQQLPTEIMKQAVKGISYIAHPLRLQILEFLLLNGESNVTQIVQGINSEQLKVSQYLRRLKDDAFVSSRRDGRFIYYSITKGVHKTALQCIRKRYAKIGRLV